MSCLAAGGAGAGLLMPGLAGADTQQAAATGTPRPARGGTAIIGIIQEPTQLASALTSAGPTQQVSGKIFDGLLAYAVDSRPQPQCEHLRPEEFSSPAGPTSRQRSPPPTRFRATLYAAGS